MVVHTASKWEGGDSHPARLVPELCVNLGTLEMSVGLPVARSWSARKSRRTAGFGAGRPRCKNLPPSSCRYRDVPGWFLPTGSSRAAGEGETDCLAPKQLGSRKKGTVTSRTPRIFRWASSRLAGVQAREAS